MSNSIQPIDVIFVRDDAGVEQVEARLTKALVGFEYLVSLPGIGTYGLLFSAQNAQALGEALIEAALARSPAPAPDAAPDDDSAQEEA